MDRSLVRVLALLSVIGVASLALAQTGTVGPVTIFPGVGGMARFASGTASAPSVSFVANPLDGFYWSSAGHIVYTANGSATLDLGSGFTLGSGSALGFSSAASADPASNIDTYFTRAAAGHLQLQGLTVGVRFKVDTLPTVASGFGTSPSITAGSTPLAGSVNVGTGGVATSGIVNFNGTAFPTAPFCTATTTTTNATTRVATSTTQLTLNSTTAWGASDVVSWICISAK